MVYRILNKVTGKSYIGMTRTGLAQRWKAHCHSKSHCRLLANSIAKHGKGAFDLSVLHTTDNQAELKQKEIEFIKEYNSLAPNGYNLTTGGEEEAPGSHSKDQG